MRLPEDPAKLKRLTREYIIKHCRTLEKKLDALEKQVLEWERVQKGLVDFSHRMFDKQIVEFMETELNDRNLGRLRQLLREYETWDIYEDMHKETLFKIKCLLEHLEGGE